MQTVETKFDLVVIGAGIHGAGVAQAAASMGYRVLILEQADIASGTSSRSSKLIHGGLRYLETFQFGLVRECLQERETLLKIAPQLVQLLPFNIPVFTQTSRRSWQIRLGLMLYYGLAGFNEHARFKTIKDLSELSDDGLTQQKLVTVFRYFDAQTDDRLLTKAVIESAVNFGAQIIMPAKVKAVTRQSAEWRVDYATAAGAADSFCLTSCVINATGPWINRLHEKIIPAAPRLDVDLVQGTHIVVQRPAKSAAYYIESPIDKRAVFVLPWQQMTMIGTTEVPYQGDPGKVSPQQAEIDYLLDSYNAYFPDPPIAERDIHSQFAGLRVLPRQTNSPTKRKRETLLLSDGKNCPGYVAIYGGKLTAFRRTAERVMVVLRPYLKSTVSRIKTSEIPLQTALSNRSSDR